VRTCLTLHLPDASAADFLSAIDFDETGDYLATGDRGGRAVVFERGAVEKLRACSQLDA
jgi:serine/threonine-protein phosphatase 2A regulatory subunit B